MALLAAVSLFGFISSANILLETSSAIIISIPLRFTVTSFEPSCGPASPIVKNNNAKKVSQNFHLILDKENPGINFFTNFSSPKASNNFLLLLRE
jgi:hypothetical protein